MPQTLALARYRDRISPLFDSSQVMLILKIDNGIEIDRQQLDFTVSSPIARAHELSQLGVDVLICGAISYIFSQMVEAQGIQIIPFIAGDIEPVIRSFLDGTLQSANFCMPGCGNQHRRRYRGGRSNSLL